MTAMRPTFRRIVAAGVASLLESDGWRKLEGPTHDLAEASILAVGTRHIGKPFLHMRCDRWAFSLAPVDRGHGDLNVILTKQGTRLWDSFDMHIDAPSDAMRRISAVIRAGVGEIPQRAG
jgi:hypothetical protein